MREHRPFLIALAVAAVVRVAVMIAFPPGFVLSDGPTYLGLVDDLTPRTDRTVGYGFLLDALAAVSRDVWLVSAVQHVLGLLTAVLLYTLLRRWSVSAGLATLACLPVLFDAMQLVLEHSPLSDVLFDLLVVAGVAALAWHRQPSVATAAIGGLLLGLSVCVRVAGQPLVVVAVLFCLWAATTWRARVLTSVVVALSFAVPVTAYAAWYHAERGVWALTESGGRALYMRTTGFVDCSAFTMPEYERPLCPAEPLGSRLDPTDYGWHTPDATHGLVLPPGITYDEAMGDFARRAIRAQPGAYARIVARDLMLGFTGERTDHYEYDTAYKWRFDTYVMWDPTARSREAYATHGGDQPEVRQPVADWLAWYGWTVYVWGPLLFLLTVLAVVGLIAPVGRGGRAHNRQGTARPREPAVTRPVVFLVLATALGLLAAPAVTAQFVWRYQLPFVVLVPAAAVLALVRLSALSGVQPGAQPVPSPMVSPAPSPRPAPTGRTAARRAVRGTASRAPRTGRRS
jgi:hypothetical protein